MDGIGELQAYENFGKRCQLGAYRKLSSMLVQNVRKGAKGMQKLLEEEEWEAYEQRKSLFTRLVICVLNNAAKLINITMIKITSTTPIPFSSN